MIRLALVPLLAGVLLPTAPAVAAVACALPPTATVTTAPWSAARLSLSRAWSLSEGAGVVVGVVDSGVDARQPALAGRVTAGVDVVPGGGPATVDCVGHGTFVAGLVAAGHQNGVGFAGVAPQAVIAPVRQTTDGRDGTVDTLADAIRAAVDQRAQVINASITYGQSNPRLADAIRYALDHDVVVVAAAGNSDGGGNADAVNYPAAYPGVLSVGAIDAHDAVTQFSQTRTPISVVAPGADLVGPGAGGTGLVTGREGTSFAAAFVSGVAALIRAYRPGLRADQVVHRVLVTADRPPGTVPDARYGWGVVNPYQALTEELPEEYAGRPAPAPVSTLAVPGAPRPGRGDVTLPITAGLLGLAGLIAAGARAGRRRAP